MPKTIADTIVDLSQLPADETLARMSHAELMSLRDRLGGQQLQNRVAPFEHRAFARELTSENPLMSVPLAVATPLYQVSKLLPRSLTGNQSRSGPSMEQVSQGIVGVGEGLSNAASNAATTIGRFLTGLRK